MDLFSPKPKAIAADLNDYVRHYLGPVFYTLHDFHLAARCHLL
jgi:hypothetical protein